MAKLIVFDNDIAMDPKEVAAVWHDKPNEKVIFILRSGRGWQIDNVVFEEAVNIINESRTE